MGSALTASSHTRRGMASDGLGCGRHRGAEMMELCLAARNGNVAEVRRMVGQGANVNVESSGGPFTRRQIGDEWRW